MTFVKEVGLIIDLHQSPVQEESVFKQAVNDLYIPLIRLIKSKRDMKITLSVPLSTLELLDKYDFGSQISEIKDLCTAEKIDLVGAPAYGALLDDLPNDIIEKQIILNEYAMGYYLGARQGFEGEPSIMIKDLQGFVPSQLYINNQILKSVGGLGYSWVATDNCSIPKKHQKPESCVYKIAGSEVGIVKLDQEIIDIINFGVRGNLSEYKKKIQNKINTGWKENLFYFRSFESFLDADSYKKKFELIDVLIETLEESKIAVVDIPTLIKKAEIVEIDKEESLEYKKNEDGDKNDPIAFYFNSKDDKLTELKKLDIEMAKVSMKINEKGDMTDILTLPIWEEESCTRINDVLLHQYVCYFILLSKYISFDKYLYLNQCLNDPDRKEICFKQIHEFTHLATRSLTIIPDFAERDSLLARIQAI